MNTQPSTNVLNKIHECSRSPNKKDKIIVVCSKGESSPPPQEDQPKRKRRVMLDDQVSVFEIHSRTEYTYDEVRACWYSPSEIKMFRSDCCTMARTPMADGCFLEEHWRRLLRKGPGAPDKADFQKQKVGYSQGHVCGIYRTRNTMFLDRRWSAQRPSRRVDTTDVSGAISRVQSQRETQRTFRSGGSGFRSWKGGWLFQQNFPIMERMVVPAESPGRHSKCCPKCPQRAATSITM
jgi:hypothetical protein